MIDVTQMLGDQQTLAVFFVGLLITMGIFVIASFLYLFLAPFHGAHGSGKMVNMRPHENEYSQNEAMLDERNKAA